MFKPALLLVSILQAQCHLILQIPQLDPFSVPPICNDSHAFDNMLYEDGKVMAYEDTVTTGMEYEG
jgi:hypothetical protein